MDFSYSDEHIRFRNELRRWLAANLPSGWGADVHEPTDENERAQFRLAWERKLHEGGWIGLNWPKEYGGRGATQIEQGIFAEEMARARAPEGLNIIGRNLVGPTLLRHGTDAQRRRYLPKILSSEEVWCQGFSEPNAGSDLASLRCAALREGDDFIVNGQKVWTSFAQHSHWCILLARTDPAAPKHHGLSVLLVDMRSPGITVRPLRQISGESEFNETFFANVRVPAENLVGELNTGWQIAQTTLAAERGPDDALARQIRFKQELDGLLAAASRIDSGGRRAIDDPALRQKLALAIVEIEVMRLACLRMYSRMARGTNRGPEVSMLKLYWSHAAQRMYDTALQVCGPLAPLTAGDPHSVSEGRYQLSYLHSRAFSIFSGTSEIQRNIIAERLLGLPR